MTYSWHSEQSLILKRLHFSRAFFKSGPGEYGEGDQFRGVTVPRQRKIARQFRNLDLTEIEQLITSTWHEERLTALLILVDQFQRGGHTQAIYDFYMNHTTYVNNWDLVDSSAPYIVGPFLYRNPVKAAILTRLAQSELLWERRIAIMATYYDIKQGSADMTLVIAELLVADSHDLIHKAVGWMLREIASRVDKTLTVAFLNRYAVSMPRTMLRYAIEKFPQAERKYFLSLRTKLT